MSARDIFDIYRTRFQLEFVFRDAKQFTGLTHCQARNKEALSFAFNASLTSVNLASLLTLTMERSGGGKGCSLSYLLPINPLDGGGSADIMEHH